MKTLPLHSTLAAFACATVALFVSSTAHAAGLYEYVNLGAAASTADHRWAVLSLGNYPASAASTIGAKAVIHGDVGVGGSGAININAQAKLEQYLANDTNSTKQSFLYYQNGGNPAVNGGATINGSTTGGRFATDLSTAVANARSGANTAAGFTTNTDTANYPTNNLSIALTGASGPNSALTLTAGNNQRYVLNIDSLSIANGAILTLDGNAGSSFILNISGSYTMNKGQIVLVNGVKASNVLINYTGSNNVVISSSTVNGIILAATNSNYQSSVVTLTSTTLNGQVIANKVSIAGGVVNTVVSP